MSTGWTAPGATSPEPRSGAEHEPGAAQVPGAPGRGAPGTPPSSGPARELDATLPLFPLRPLSLGEILGAAVRIYRLRARPTLALSASVFGVAFVLITVSTGVGMLPLIGQIQTAMEDPTAESSSFTSVGDLASVVGSTLITSLITLVAAAVVTVPLTRIAIDAATGGREEDQRVWATTRRFGISAVAVSLIASLLVLAVFALPVVLGALPMVLMLEPSPLTVVPLVTGLVVGVLAAVWVWSRLLMAIPALAVEGPGVLGALRRSFALTSGRRVWRVLGIGVLVYVLYYLASQVVAGVFGTVGTVLYLAILLASSFESVTLGVMVLTVISMIGAYVATFLLTPFYAAAIAALYADVRMRHEAWDIELVRTVREQRHRSPLRDHAADGPAGTDPAGTGPADGFPVGARPIDPAGPAAGVMAAGPSTGRTAARSRR